ncbi:2-amino-4-hydroxy-6-hydroxymethyldihydropteridine diphosphokinase [Pseudoclavibacter chungangensis]|uniref:2-amino-4-hydroxy-6-hydroxymethyldihydropteridine diphosphokinase n=1 Tax=Pseudoclavibacter chungangensis TaxID=587635 RepID=A0A7J5BNE2_9MICO|nr:2-amino-4-hydroxy-6-hydroxymethyldihydropteridine diphosphokinase [Pseudoclavibacter chungangensis]KAB1653637.1 2-amino-4-hydroxy-6-hydroxymethyldihydropteridine diphosphokinase [Pseudoclavibacter chungangensis]NYJ68751.1 2-amino-4-hydroxy-6-hydroxymethyldihydropteridine diphosphokinase [Pseudoclavibacter chungangensis]
MSGERRRAVIALGGNMGDRTEILRRGMSDIDELDGTRVVIASSLYETPALTMHGIDETVRPYLNAVVIVTTDRNPHELLSLLQTIEDRHGRRRGERWGSRTLDLDIISMDGIELATETLEIPHPAAWQRAFVLAPWHEIDPDAQIPGRGSVEQLLSVATDRVLLYAESGLGARGREGVSTDRGLPLRCPTEGGDAGTATER